MTYPQNRETRVSETFISSDADVIFESSDGILFHIHRKNLEVCTGAFPPSEIQTNGEHVFLSETGDILELLFKFTYPAKQPDLEDFGIDVVGPLAEAAEKYEVYTAMTFCQKRMKELIPQHGVDVYLYATKHDYPKLIAQALPFVIGRPLSEVIPMLPQHLVLPWLLYTEAWGRVHLQALSGRNTGVYASNDIDEHENNCHGSYWPSIARQIRLRLDLGIKSLLDLDVLFRPERSPNSCCQNALKKWRTKVEKSIENIPQLRSFIHA